MEDLFLPSTESQDKQVINIKRFDVCGSSRCAARKNELAEYSSNLPSFQLDMNKLNAFACEGSVVRSPPSP